VLLLVLDTVRDFNVSASGYERRTTPALERMAAEGVRFDRAFATAPWTLPSHGSMFTGRFTHELSTTLTRPLDGTFPTIAEALREAGYATGGFAANMKYVTWLYGLDRGFMRFEDYPVSLSGLVNSTAVGRRALAREDVRALVGYYDLPERKSAAAVADDFLRWARGKGGAGRPFFAFLNLFDAHHPYLPPAPFDTMFGPRARPTGVPHQLKFKDVPAVEITRNMSMYDGGIAYMDREIDRMLGELERRGVLDNTVVIVTSDHGEHWGDHELLGHGNSMYRQLLQVPLVMRYPARLPRGRVVREAVSLRDIPATVLELTGVPNRKALPGASLAAYLDPTRAPGAWERPVLSTNSSFKDKGGSSLITDGWHYIRKARGDEELFDFERDPHDLVNLVDTPAGRAALPRIRARYDSLLGKWATKLTGE
jgi:arylsulfatase A-like enzyme